MALELKQAEARRALMLKKREMPPALAASLRESDGELNAQSLLVESKRRDIEAIRTRYAQDRARYIMLTETHPGAGAQR